MNSDPNNQAAPTNGEPSVNVTSSAVKKESRRKSASPRELYKMMYEGNVSSQDLKNIRIGERSEVPVKVVGYLKRRMDGAASRVTTIKKQVGEYTQLIRNRSAKPLAQSEVDGYRVKKLRARADLLVVRDEYQMFKQFYEDALEGNSVPLKQKIVAAREDAFAERMAPSKTKSAINILSVASTDGKAAAVLQLKQIASGPRDAFREKFVELILALDGKLHAELVKRPKLLTKVVGRVAAHYQADEV